MGIYTREEAWSTIMEKLRKQKTEAYQFFQRQPTAFLTKHRHLFKRRSQQNKLAADRDAIQCWLRSVETGKLPKERYLQHPAAAQFFTPRRATTNTQIATPLQPTFLVPQIRPPPDPDRLTILGITPQTNVLEIHHFQVYNDY